MKFLWWKITIKKALPDKSKRKSSKKATNFQKDLFSLITKLVKLIIVLVLLLVIYITLRYWFLTLEIFENWEPKDVSSVIISILTIASAGSLLN